VSRELAVVVRRSLQRVGVLDRLTRVCIVSGDQQRQLVGARGLTSALRLCAGGRLFSSAAMGTSLSAVDPGESYADSPPNTDRLTDLTLCRSAYSGMSASYPSYPTIFLAPGDNSYERVGYTTDSSTYTFIRHEGSLLGYGAVG
jgi:hypothetical protein